MHGNCMEADRKLKLLLRNSKEKMKSEPEDNDESMVNILIEWGLLPDYVGSNDDVGNKPSVTIS